MTATIDDVRSCFLDYAAGAFEMPIGTVLSDGKFLVMTADHRSTRSATVKTLSLNSESRVPSVHGTITWSNLDSEKHVVVDAGAVTALCTGAVSGVATDLLAPATASTCAVIGAGVQDIDQARAVHAAGPLDELARANQMCETLTAELGPPVRMRASTDSIKAVEGKDIVCRETTARSPLFAPEALGERTHVNAIGAFRPTMREVPIGTLASSYVVVDDLPAVLEESGEVIDALAAGAITTDQLVGLGAALKLPPAPTGRTVFKSVGVAIQDWAIADALARIDLTSEVPVATAGAGR